MINNKSMRNICKILLIGILCLPIYFAVIWKSIMPDEPMLRTSWSDSEFNKNYGSVVFKEFLRLDLPDKKYGRTKYADFIHLFAGRSDPRIVLTMTYDNTSIKEVTQSIFSNPGVKDSVSFIKNETLSQGGNREFYFDKSCDVLIMLIENNGSVECYIQNITAQEMEKIK